MDIVGFLSDLPAILGTHLSTIIGLIFMDVVVGIALAVKMGVFDWNRVAEFYATNVLPYILGYIAVAGGTLFITAELLPGDVAEALGLVGSWLSFGAIAAQVVFGSLLPNVKDLIVGRFQGGTPIVG